MCMNPCIESAAHRINIWGNNISGGSKHLFYSNDQLSDAQWHLRLFMGTKLKSGTIWGDNQTKLWRVMIHILSLDVGSNIKYNFPDHIPAPDRMQPLDFNDSPQDKLYIFNSENSWIIRMIKSPRT